MIELSSWTPGNCKVASWLNLVERTSFMRIPYQYAQCCRNCCIHDDQLHLYLQRPMLYSTSNFPSKSRACPGAGDTILVSSGAHVCTLRGGNGEASWSLGELRIKKFYRGQLLSQNASITEGYVRFTASLDKFALVSFERRELKGSLDNFFHLGTSFYVLLHDWHLPLECLGPPYVCLHVYTLIISISA